MIDLTIYGKPSYNFEYYKHLVQGFAKEAKIKLNISEKTELVDFFEIGITSIPAFRIGDEFFEIKNHQSNEIINLKNWILNKENFGSLPHYLVPIDFSETSENAIQYALHLNREKPGVITLIHAIHPTLKDAELGMDNIKDLQEYYEVKLKNYITSITESSFLDEDFDVINYKVLTGPAGHTIRAYADNIPRSIIIIGSTGKGGILKKAFGSVSTEIASRSNCPVFVIPPKLKRNSSSSLALLVSELENDMEVVSQLTEIDSITIESLEILAVNQFDYPIAELVTKIESLFNHEVKISSKLIKSEISLEDINRFCSTKNIDLLVMSQAKKHGIKAILDVLNTKQVSMKSITPTLIISKNEE